MTGTFLTGPGTDTPPVGTELVPPVWTEPVPPVGTELVIPVGTEPVIPVATEPVIPVAELNVYWDVLSVYSALFTMLP